MRGVCRNKWPIVLLACCMAAVLSGCADRFYTPRPTAFAPGVVKDYSFQTVSRVRLVNALPGAKKMVLGKYTHKWRADLHEWTRAAMDLMETELEKRDIQTGGTGPTISLAVTHAGLKWNYHNVLCELTLGVETQDGFKKDYRTVHMAANLEEACDGALVKAAAAVLNTQAVYLSLKKPRSVMDEDGDGIEDGADACPGTPARAVIDKMGCPTDTDMDGVFDGIDQCANTPPGQMVDENGCKRDDDKDSVPNTADLCPDTPEGIAVDADGCPADSDLDGIADDRDVCADTPVGARVNASGCWEPDRIYFEEKRYSLNPLYQDALSDVVRVMEENPELAIEVHGHADDDGSPEYNKFLAEKRAKTVGDFLQQQGVTPARIKLFSYGSLRPMDTRDNASAHARNRRVEIIPGR